MTSCNKQDILVTTQIAYMAAAASSLRACEIEEGKRRLSRGEGQGKKWGPGGYKPGHKSPLLFGFSSLLRYHSSEPACAVQSENLPRTSLQQLHLGPHARIGLCVFYLEFGKLSLQESNPADIKRSDAGGSVA